MPTKIALLSRNPALYSSQRLVEAARQRGCTVRVLDPLRCALKVAPGAFEVRYKGKPLPRFDAVIPRIGHSVTFHGTAVLRHFELMGVATPSTSDAILAARDKLRSHQVLAAEGIDLPVTAFGDSPDDTPALIELVGPAPHVVKLNEGTQGSGVVLAQDEAASR
ncbi:MAG: 30S ribosomal protein S6--L-glutamate ligase, partial [Lysobacteraceae bacterium]